jgi:hypothetical protein
MSTSMPQYQPYPYQPSPQPPTMHWAIVLLLSIVTLGFFAFFWAYRQAAFARKIDPANPKTKLATFQVLVSFTLMLFSFALGFINAWTVMRGGEGTDLHNVINMVHMFQFLTFTIASFAVRDAIKVCYGIKTNGVLTFFFNIFYLQHYLTQIERLRIPYQAPMQNPGQPGAPAMQGGR